MAKATDQPKGNVSVGEVIRYLEGDRFLTAQQVESYLSLKPMEAARLLPEHLRYRIGHRVRYRKSEVDKWMESNRSGRLQMIEHEQTADRLISKLARLQRTGTGGTKHE